MKLKLFAISFIFFASNSFSQKSLRDSLKAFTINVMEKAIKKGNIKKIAVWDFTNIHKEVTLFGSYIAEQISVYAEDIDSLQLMDRQNLKSVLKEHKLKSDGFIDQNTILELGKFKSVEAVVVGSVIVIDKDFQIVIKVIETNNGRTIAAAEEFFEIDKKLATLFGTVNNNLNEDSLKFQKQSLFEFERSKSSNEIYNDEFKPSKDCELKNFGDFCFRNNTRLRIEVIVNLGENNLKSYGDTKVINLLINPNESKCIYNLSSQTIIPYSFEVYQYTTYLDKFIIDKGNFLVEKCKSKTYVLTKGY